jgi:AraC-like DNA-binding protein
VHRSPVVLSVLVLVVHHEALRLLALAAAAHAGLAPLVLDAAPGARDAAGRALAAARRDAPEPGGLLVHDFAPDPEASGRWLDETAAGWPTLGVLALLGAPAGAALHQLVGRPRRFACVDAVLARETTARALSDRLAEAAGVARHGALVRALAAGWPLDALLTALAQRAFAMTGAPHADGGDGGPWPTLETLLRTAGVSRGTFVRHAARAGFSPPLRFLQVLRVLGVAAAVRGGDTAATAAARFGYGSRDTLRHHFAALTGLTPRDARHLPAQALVARMRGGHDA